ncbi:hypothetical protein GCM10027275_12700 [Rhabdobacter roseus]|uniref:DUF922 domain-containing protein n=1 Tax=Rhabdobacter roseus TaxID=1655419 RepID=A0A840TG96_9BACT|nr:DUF922 domain-containing protein [Rhabdobacter roseus]MBB5283186.1 hypothetical protein [Rhabdobacter roseus]
MLKIGWLLVLLLPTLSAWAQEPLLLSLQKDKISLPSSRLYYVLDVLDKRTSRPRAFGELIEYTRPRPVAFSSSMERSLYEFWSNSTPHRREESIPLVITLDELRLNEKRIGPNRVEGKLSISVIFGWNRQGTDLQLTTYQANTAYTRPETPYDHELLVRRMLSAALTHFDTWMKVNEGRHPLLVRGVKLVIRDVEHADKLDTVFYHPQRPLTWNDFRGSSDRPASRYGAAVFTSLAYEGNSRVNGKYLEAEVRVKVYMVRSLSWGLPSQRNSYTLRHEQLHFDITRLVAERFKERLKKMDLTVEDYDSQIQYEFLEAYREMDREQKKYDRETNHGLNISTQAAFDRSISEEIARIYQLN